MVSPRSTGVNWPRAWGLSPGQLGLPLEHHHTCSHTVRGYCTISRAAESQAAVLPHRTSAHHPTSTPAIIPGTTMRSGPAPRACSLALYSTTWHVHLPLAPSLLPTACILALCCIYTSCKHTRLDGKAVGRESSPCDSRSSHNGGPWRRSLRATRVTRIPIRKAGARTLALTIAAPAIVRGAGGGLACTCQASQERFSDGAVNHSPGIAPFSHGREGRRGCGFVGRGRQRVRLE